MDFTLVITVVGVALILSVILAIGWSLLIAAGKDKESYDE